MADIRSKLLGRLDSIESLPRLPEVFFRVQKVARDESASAQKLAEVIETDPPTVAHILKLANAAYYRASGNGVRSVRDAIVRLGFREVRRLVTFSCASRTFLKPSKRINHAEFWRHSLIVGSAARRIAEWQSGPPTVDYDEAFTAGILHDVGSLVLDQYFDVLYGIVCTEQARSSRPIHEIERLYLQVDHAEIGAALLEQWQLPEPIVVSVRFHHAAAEAPTIYRQIAEIVAFSDLAAGFCGLPTVGEPAANPPASVDVGSLVVPSERYAELLDYIRNEASRATAFDLAG